MRNHQFLFSVKIADEPRFDDMLAELAACVLGHVGYTPETIGAMLGDMRDALARGAADGYRECEARFLADASQLVIVVSYAGGHEWRVARALP